MNSVRMIFPVVLVALLTVSLASGQDEKKPERPFIGIHMKHAGDDSGIRIIKVLNGSPAEKKLQVNDVILKLGDIDISKRLDLQQSMGQYDPGDLVTFTIRRDQKEMTVDLKLGIRQGWSRTTIPSGDELPITADVYMTMPATDAALIVLCHQAGWSRGEYREIAPKLNQLGFSCVAIDQRSGGEVNDVVNETNKQAKSEGKETNFADAEQDMIAALKWAHKARPDSKIILWGSSYSSALALRIAGEHPELVDGVLAFAPGEYFVRFGKPEDWITTSAKKIKAPVFITSAKNELPKWQGIFDAIPGDKKTQFVPETAGNHGSRALWEKFDDNDAYWKSVKGFLEQLK